MNMWRELDDPPEVVKEPTFDFKKRFDEIVKKQVETETCLKGLFFFSVASFLLLFVGICLLLKIVSDFDSQLLNLLMRSVLK